MSARICLGRLEAERRRVADVELEDAVALGLEPLRLDQDRPAHVVADVLQLLALSDRAHASILSGAGSRDASIEERVPQDRAPDARPPRGAGRPGAASCLFWELARSTGHGSTTTSGSRRRRAGSRRCCATGARAGGSYCLDGRTVGHIVYAPAARLSRARRPSRRRRARPTRSSLTTACVEPGLRRGGLGRLLVQAMAADLVERGHSAIEAFGDTRGQTTGCVLPAEFLGGVGFKTQRAHPTTPRMRMELRTALSWKDEVELALEKVWGRRTPHAEGDPPDRIGAGRLSRLVAASAQMMPSSSLRSAALGLAPTMDFTTSPPW